LPPQYKSQYCNLHILNISFLSTEATNGRGSVYAKILIFKNKHCIFKRFSALNDPFGGQNGSFKKRVVKLSVAKDIILPGVCSTLQLNRLRPDEIRATKISWGRQPRTDARRQTKVGGKELKAER
jgi:hypothetical protein